MSGRFFPVQAMGLGQVGTIAGLNVSSLGNDGSTPFLGQLGMVLEDGGKVYRLVQKHKITASVNTSAGFIAYWCDRANFKVASDQTDSTAGRNGVAGAFLGVVTDENYCFIQIGGAQTVGVTGTTAAGASLSGSTTDGQLVSTAEGTATVNVPVAVAYGADASNLIAVYWLLGALL